ncbi:hypothetical protein Hanom_Chr12g01111061 [Helianthus anomalus]
MFRANKAKSKLQVLSFMFTSNYRRCSLPLKLTGFILYVTKSCMLRPLALTLLIFFINYGYVLRT